MTPLREHIRAELAMSVVPAVSAFAEKLAAEARRAPFGILFYGSSLRSGDLSGVLDFYVVLEQLEDWPRGPATRIANRLLPPNVEHHEMAVEGGVLRAKVAILSLSQFTRLTRGYSLDSSVWARFAQPVALVFARDEASTQRLIAAVGAAVATAAAWAARLGPEEGPPLAFWHELFARTYASELRVEKAGRAVSIVDAAPERFAAILVPALQTAGIETEQRADGSLRPLVSTAERRTALGAWWRRRLLAKPLNMARLAKAAFTFKGGADYIVWKIARHSGVEIRLSPWQRRHPILASGPVLWRLWRRGVLR
ncbi:hypothetical protein [Manganibacter manganicus]|uniref:Uncharacterized protein n=1 Tax=Manganibacter manganicus TaxID=1873176 RepID=A0A1V8RMU8_9HYPH|nr:hypothetical protein [Pseudaminobacter manganicus]OQM74443.1 hypothetical protein BFN67_22080 [Pseudaminobacter manganicus]